MKVNSAYVKVVVSISIGIVIGSVLGWAFMQYDDKYHDNAISLTIIYDALAYKYKNDPAVIDVYDICVDKNDIVKCVYDNIPFEFDFYKFHCLRKENQLFQWLDEFPSWNQNI